MNLNLDFRKSFQFWQTHAKVIKLLSGPKLQKASAFLHFCPCLIFESRTYYWIGWLLFRVSMFKNPNALAYYAKSGFRHRRMLKNLTTPLHSEGRLLALPANIRLGRKGLAATSTLAFLAVLGREPSIFLFISLTLPLSQTCFPQTL